MQFFPIKFGTNFRFMSINVFFSKNVDIIVLYFNFIWLMVKFKDSIFTLNIIKVRIINTISDQIFNVSRFPLVNQNAEMAIQCKLFLYYLFFFMLQFSDLVCKSIQNSWVGV